MSMQIQASVARMQNLPEPSLGAQIKEAVCLSPCMAAAGALNGYLSTVMFTAINPALGAAFVAIYAPITFVATPIFEKFISSKDHPTLAKLLSGTVTIITSATLAKVLLGAAGISLTAGNVAAIIASGIAMALTFTAAAVVAALVLLGCSACFCPDQLPDLSELRNALSNAWAERIG